MRISMAALLLALVLLTLPQAAHADGAPSGAPGAALPAAPPSPAAREVLAPRPGGAGARGVATQGDTGLPVEGWRAAVRALYQPETRIGSGLGGYDAARATAELSITHNLSSRFQLAGELRLERGTYDFSDDAALVPAGAGRLGGTMSGVLAALGGSWSLNRSFGVTLGGSVRWLSMEGADLADGFQPGVIAAVRVRLFGTTDVILGGSLTQGLEDDAYVLPLLGLGGGAQGEPSRWRVEARGPGAVLSYELTERLTVGLFGGYERRDVRLASDDRLPGGVLRERRLPLGLELGWKLRRDSLLLLSGGASVWNRLTLLDRDGGTALSVATDPAPFVQLEWTARF